MKKYKKSLLLIIVSVCLLLIGISCIGISAASALINDKTASDDYEPREEETEDSGYDKDAAGSWKLSDERIEDSGYAYELTYQLIGEEVKYLYMTPDKGKFTGDKIEIGLNYGRNYYSYIKCNGLEMCINAGTCHVSCEKYSFVTNVFSLKQLP